jgi:hypothetical protein
VGLFVLTISKITVMNVKQLESLLFLSKEFAPLGLSNHTLADTLLKLKRLNKTIEKYNIIACERELRDTETAAQDRAEKAAETICKDVLKCGLQLTNDPRGIAIGLLLPSKRSNSFDGETWRIDY